MYEKTNLSNYAVWLVQELFVLISGAKVMHSPHTTKSVQPIADIFQPICAVSEIFSISAPKLRLVNFLTVARRRKILCKIYFFSKNLLIFAAKFHINFLTNEKQVFYPKLYEGHGCLHVCNNAVGWFYRLYSQ